MLQDLGNLGQALAALIALFGIPLAVRQLRIQNRISRVDIARDLEAKWCTRADGAREKRPLGEAILSEESINLVLKTYASLGVRPAFPAGKYRSSFPRAVMIMAPDMGDAIKAAGEDVVPVAGPRNEKEYKDVLVRRCRLMFPVLDGLATSTNEKHRGDIGRVIQSTYSFAASISEVAEMFDFELANPEQFMDKRHLAVVRDVHILEPFLLWQAIRAGDHRSIRGLRTLALGVSARSYTWLTPLHGRASIDMRYEAANHLEEASYGPILQSGTKLARLPARARRRCLKQAVHRPFRDHTKRAQNRLIDDVARVCGEVAADAESGHSVASVTRIQDERAVSS